MRYYIIHENQIIIANNQTAFIHNGYTEQIHELPEDYNSEKYIVVDGELILNPNYEKEQEEKEKERIKMLSCTKRDFALLLQELGVTYSQLKEKIATNEQAQLEWDLCERLYRFNPLLDTMAVSMGITSQQLDMLFKVANGENTVDDLKATVSS